MTVRYRLARTTGFVHFTGVHRVRGVQCAGVETVGNIPTQLYLLTPWASSHGLGTRSTALDAKADADRSSIAVVRSSFQFGGLALALLLQPTRSFAQPASAPLAQGAPGAAPAASGTAQVAPGAAPAAPGTVPAASGAAPAAQGRWMPSPDGRYMWVPAGYELPPVMPYREGQAVPPGYHLEERPIRAALITGYVVTGVPYIVGLLVAATSGFPNQSAFLLVPWAGPWLTLGLRENRCETETSEDAAAESDDCIQDVAAGFALVFDGLIQAAGGALVLVGYLAPQTKMVRDAPPVSVTVQRLGTGYGVSAVGVF